MRIGKLELRESYGKLEIVKWFKNPYYGKENKYNKEGEFYFKTDRLIKIHESCFENPESCYTIAFIELGVTRFVDDRAYDIKQGKEMNDFMYLAEMGTEKIKTNN